MEEVTDLFKAAAIAVRQQLETMGTDGEIGTRLQRMQPLYVELIELNRKLTEISPLRIQAELDAETGVVTIQLDGKVATQIKLNRADPNVPITTVGSTEVGTYVAGMKEEDTSELQEELRAAMESKLENFYQSAHRIMKLINIINGAKKPKAQGVTLVRNQLIEHPPEGALYSFGWSSEGPKIKPQSRGDLKWNDAGLTPNTIEFLHEIIRCCN